LAGEYFVENYSGVIKLSQGMGFLPKALLKTDLLSQVSMYHFDVNIAVETEGVLLVDFPHTHAAQFSINPIALV
jgi:hypothetical protein